MDKPQARRTSLLAGVLVLAAASPFVAGSGPSAGLAAGASRYTLAAARTHYDPAHYTPAACGTPRRPAAGKIYAHCDAVVWTSNLKHQITANAAGPPSTALGPADIQSAYKLPAGGGGQTVAIVDAFGDSHAESDLATFRAQYGLPPCTTANGCFKKVDQTGGTAYPPDDPGWGLETSLDLDAVSSACPACNILLVEGNSPTIGDLGAAVDEAVVLGAKYVSNSYGTSEFSGEQSFDQFYDHPGVAVTASTGDSGFGTAWPSTSPTVTGVGGTSLTKDAAAARGWDETVWGGTGSGCSPVEPKPEFQNGVTTDCDNRAVSDIAADADPASGLATYDTLGQNGWLQVGGTSLASPLIAAIYALAGPPVASTDPASYPYHDPNQSSDLFDITSGSNGTCGNLLCTAGRGWDGPTGLGTPDGVKALETGQHGEVTGQVTDQTADKPIAGATVTANPGDYVTRTAADGTYRLDLAVGSYTVTASAFGFQQASQSGVQVIASQTTTVNLALAGQPQATLSGAVTDGSGHGWPLHAQITVLGTPLQPVFTSPYTGQYSIALPEGSYTLNVRTDYPGYPTRQVPVNVSSTSVRDNITLPADLAACDAPGYGFNGLTEDFTGWGGTTPRDGWTVTGTGWRFDNPAGRPPVPTDPVLFAPGGDDQFAIADSGFAGHGRIDTTLTSPSVSVAGQATPHLEFDTAYYAYGDRQAAAVQLSTDGGATWTTVWQQTSANALGHVQIQIPQAAGHGVRVRFHYNANDAWYWAIDNVFIGTHACVPLPGGLLAGLVTDQATANPIDGAQVLPAGAQLAPPFPAGVSLATSDPAVPGGFYWLFSPTSSQQFTATATGFATATASVNVTADQVTRQDWALTAAGGG